MVNKVSVIIPVFNNQRRLLKCLRSLYGQEQVDFEVIVIDDASDIDLSGVVKLFPCKYLRLPVNHGPAYARNYGAKHSTGEIILFTDSDCYVMEDWVNVFSQELIRSSQHTNIVAICGLLKSDPGFIAMTNVYTGYAYVVSGQRRFLEYLNTSCVAIFKEAFEKAGGFAEDMRNGEDTELALKLIENGKKVLFVPSIWIYHDHGVHRFKDMVYKHFRWGKDIGLSLMSKHPSRFKRVYPLLLNPVMHFLLIVPLAIATTIKIIVYNIRSDKWAFIYAPFILVNKVSFRCGVFLTAFHLGRQVKRC